MAITSFMAIAALLIFAVPATGQGQGVSKRGLDSQQLARMTARIKSLVDEGAIVELPLLVLVTKELNKLRIMPGKTLRRG